MIELMREMDRSNSDYRLFLGDSANDMIEAETGERWYRRHVVGRPRPPRPVSLVRNELALRRLVRPSDVVHRTYHARLNLLPKSVRVVETLHDLWDQLHGDRQSPRLRLRHALKRRALHRADVVVCVSQYTQDTLAEVWPEIYQKSLVIHHGVREFHESSSTYVVEAPFFLFVGKRDLYKNFDLAIRALASAPGLKDFYLVCFGGGRFSVAETEQISSLGLSERVRLVSGGDELLGTLYRNAAALLYPSRHEGFGLPLLEAMICDCPVITAPCTSLPEVAAGAALYAKPDDRDGWAGNMESIVFDSDRRSALVVSGRERATRFSWRASAQAHAELYASLQS